MGTDLPEPIVTAGEQLLENVADLSVSLTRDLCHSLPELRALPEITAHLERSIADNMGGFFDALRHGIPAKEIVPPPNALYLPRYLAHVVDAPDLIMRIYHSGHSRIWLDWTMPALCEASAAAAENAWPHLSYVYSQQHEYLFRVGSLVSTEYLRERSRVQSSPRSALHRIVSQVMVGHTVQETDLKRLRYNFNGNHCALVCWIPPTSSLEEIDLTDLTRELCTAISSGPSLIIPGRANEAWGWIQVSEHRQASSCGGTVRRVITDILRNYPHTVHVTLGDIRTGVEGFRASHKDALRAQSVITAGPESASSITEYGDVALIGLLLSDRDAARSFVSRTLGPLAESTPETKRLRETALEFLRCNRSYARAAETLHLHRNTVLYRLQKAEALLGSRVEDAGPDLLSALILVDWHADLIG